MILNAVIKGGGGDDGIVKFSYTGSCVIDGNILRLLDSGTFTPLSNDVFVDLFLVGGGGGGGKGVGQSTSVTRRASGGGGGGGYTWSQLSVLIPASLQCAVQIGAGGAALTAGGTTTFVGDNLSLSADGGLSGSTGSTSSYYGGAGGNGGSGGGAGAYYSGTDGTQAMSTPKAGATDGANGLPTTESTYQKTGGTGQGTTTRAFGEDDGELFATGGSGGRLVNALASDALPNTGNGGDGGNTNNAGASANIAGASGGSGIILIRFPEGTELAQVA